MTAQVGLQWTKEASYNRRPLTASVELLFEFLRQSASGGVILAGSWLNSRDKPVLGSEDVYVAGQALI